jgi:TRAP-type C4-dicarboxylate transport system substrate-binding protein
MVCATPALAVEWDFATINPATNYQTEAAEKFAAEVAVATKNGVKISVHAGGALGFKGPDMLGAVRDGLVPIGSMLINQQVGLSPILGVSSLPYLVSGIDEMKTFRDTSRSIFQNEFAKYNQKLLFVVPWPGQNIFSKSELSKAETFRAMKIRTLDRNGSEFFRNLGASPAQIPWGEVVPALATGVIDSVTTSSSSAVDGQFWEFLKFCTIVNWQSNFEAVSVNLDAWNKISPKDQKIIEQAAENVEAEFWTTAKAEDSKNFETLKSKGVQVVDAPPAVRDFMLEKGKPTWAAFAQSVPAAKSLIEKYLAATGK